MEQSPSRSIWRVYFVISPLVNTPTQQAMCEEYGIELTEEHIQTVKAIANDNGEVRGGPCSNVAITRYTLNSQHYIIISRKYFIKQNLQVRKNDFIYHIKASNMFSLFESIDPDSHSRWQTLAGLDFFQYRYIYKINHLESFNFST